MLPTGSSARRYGAVPCEPALVLGRQQDDRRPGGVFEELDQLVCVRRLAARRGHDRLYPPGARGQRAAGVELGDLAQLVQLATPDSPQLYASSPSRR